MKPTSVVLPDKIEGIDFKPSSKTTLVLTMNKGWVISMRIHNASTFVEPSLKFDIQLQEAPKDMCYMECEW